MPCNFKVFLLGVDVNVFHRTSADIDIVCGLEYNIFIAGFAVDVQDDQSAKSFVTPCSYAGRFLR